MSLALKHAVDRSYNCISVDGDTSTNDTFAVLANGRAYGTRPQPGVQRCLLAAGCVDRVSLAAVISDPGSPLFASFRTALTDTAIELAKKIVRCAFI